MEDITVDADQCLIVKKDVVVNSMQSLSNRLIRSEGKFLAAQGHITAGPYTIGFGIIDYVEFPRAVETWVPAYRYSRHRNLDHSIPSKMSDIPVPAKPLVYCRPVDDVTSIQNLLKNLGFEHYNDQYHIHREKCVTPINPVNHQDIPDFKQDYVARVYVDEETMDILWPLEKQASGGI